MKVAIVHDWLTGMRGGEVVLDSILKIFPEAELFTLFYTPNQLNYRIENRKIHTAFTNKLPFKDQKYRYYLPLFPTAIESFDFRDFDLILSSSHCVAKGIIPPPGVIHLSYLHTPMRYVWDLYYDYFPQKSGLKFFLLSMIANYLRMWDVTSSGRVDSFTCNSSFVAKRIKKYYSRDAKVIHPPCLEANFQVEEQKKEDYYLIVSAFAPYKKIGLAIEAFTKNKRKLIVIGGGQEENSLKKNLPDNVTILTRVPKEEIVEYYKKARGFIFPGLEDFGITPVESQAYCTPVIAFGKGGALETVIKGKTGVFFYNQQADDLNNAIEEFESLSFKKDDFQNSINRFTEEKFINEIKNEVDRLIKETSF
ncbi:MAG: glycosyltransferase [Leptospiraceae bacterium]|nr:glycosyltransferase [Leptospiraceae bacterium]MCP5496872.1 glycosyltransferase [Leptospiraceae bacterium]